MMFCLPTILDNVLSREWCFTSMPPEELPQLLALVVRYDALNLIEIKREGPTLNLDVAPHEPSKERTCLIREATILSTV